MPPSKSDMKKSKPQKKGQKAAKPVQKQVEEVEEKKKRKGQSAEEKTSKKLAKVANNTHQNRAPTRKSLGLAAKPAPAEHAFQKKIKQKKRKAEVVVLPDSTEDESSSGDTVLYEGPVVSTGGTPNSARKPRKKRVSLAWANANVKMPSNEDKTLVSIFYLYQFMSVFNANC
jgi:hypothetical protein